MILRENFHENKKGQYMNALISIISIILFIVLGIIIYNGLNGMDLKKKIVIFIFEIIVCLIFTMILFNISDKTLKNTDYAELRNDEIQK